MGALFTIFKSNKKQIKDDIYHGQLRNTKLHVACDIKKNFE